MSDQLQRAKQNAGAQGDLQGLAEQLGPADLLALLSPAISEQFQRINSIADLRQFLITYREERLFRHELPVILKAYQHGVCGEARELIALDKALSAGETIRSLASASRRVGRQQLLRLRPMKDVRLVQRYLSAVESGEANGWHTLVYGMILSLFSLPLRQGLVNYAFQTIQAFVFSAGRRLALSEMDCRQLIDEVISPTANAIERILEADRSAVLRVTE